MIPNTLFIDLIISNVKYHWAFWAFIQSHIQDRATRYKFLSIVFHHHWYLCLSFYWSELVLLRCKNTLFSLKCLICSIICYLSFQFEKILSWCTSMNNCLYMVLNLTSNILFWFSCTWTYILFRLYNLSITRLTSSFWFSWSWINKLFNM